jgi:hydroxypyruvate isomerase
MKFAPNLTMLFNDSPFLERFARARACGFEYVEFQFPYEHKIEHVQHALKENDLKVVLFNMPPGNWAAGERGLASLPDRQEAFRESVGYAIEWASALGAPRMNCLAGNRDANVPLEEQKRALVENLRYAASEFERNGIALGIEHLNPNDMPNFLLPTPSSAFEIQEKVAHPNLLVQYDVYHAQRTEGELANTLARNLPRIGHIQIADNPGRHQPLTGEINYAFLLRFLEGIGYKHFVGLEYLADGKAENSFGWIKSFGFSSAENESGKDRPAPQSD